MVDLMSADITDYVFMSLLYIYLASKIARGAFEQLQARNEQSWFRRSVL